MRGGININAYSDNLGKLVKITTGFFSSSIGELIEYEEDSFLYKVPVGQGCVIVGLNDFRYLTTEETETHRKWLDKFRDMPFEDDEDGLF